MSRIAKIKLKDGTVLILDISGQGTANEIETTHKIYAEPHKDFSDAMDALVAQARDILDWPASYAQGRIRITGVSFSFSEDTKVEGAVMTGLVNVDKADAPFSFNTPHLPFDQYNPGGVAKTMPEDAVEALNILREEARAFLKGKRSQGDLFMQPDDAKSRAANDTTAH